MWLRLVAQLGTLWRVPQDWFFARAFFVTSTVASVVLSLVCEDDVRGMPSLRIIADIIGAEVRPMVRDPPPPIDDMKAPAIDRELKLYKLPSVLTVALLMSAVDASMARERADAHCPHFHTSTSQEAVR